MVRGATRRTGFTGSALIRLLARLTDVDAPDSPQAFAERLSHWLGWTDAIALSTALAHVQAGGPATAAAAAADPDVEESTRVHDTLTRALADDGTRPADPRPARGRNPRPAEPPPIGAMDLTAPSDFTPHRRRYAARQQAMETAIGPLRARLRARLATGSPERARLAAIDGVMEQMLAAHERQLLAGIPTMLERHFVRLHRDAPPDTTDWLDRFRHDLTAVLLAELELRWQPVDGLLEALRASPGAAP